MDPADKATDATAFIDKGNAAVELGSFADAVQLYNQALKYVAVGTRATASLECKKLLLMTATVWCLVRFLKKPGPDAQPEEDASWRTPLEVRVYGNLAQVCVQGLTRDCH